VSRKSCEKLETINVTIWEICVIVVEPSYLVWDSWSLTQKAFNCSNWTIFSSFLKRFIQHFCISGADLKQKKSVLKNIHILNLGVQIVVLFGCTPPYFFLHVPNGINEALIKENLIKILR